MAPKMAPKWNFEKGHMSQLRRVKKQKGPKNAPENAPKKSPKIKILLNWHPVHLTATPTAKTQLCKFQERPNWKLVQYHRTQSEDRVHVWQCGWSRRRRRRSRSFPLRQSKAEQNWERPRSRRVGRHCKRALAREKFRNGPMAQCNGRVREERGGGARRGRNPYGRTDAPHSTLICRWIWAAHHRRS